MQQKVYQLVVSSYIEVGLQKVNWCIKPRETERRKLKIAVKRIQSGEIEINEAVRICGVPSRTLRRRRQTEGFLRALSVGPPKLLVQTMRKGW
jgi:hypothetical protein